MYNDQEYIEKIRSKIEASRKQFENNQCKVIKTEDLWK